MENDPRDDLDRDEEQQWDQEDSDQHGQAPTDPLALDNGRLANFIRRVSPSYRWDPPPDDIELEDLFFPPLPHYAPLQRRTSSLVAGRGMVNLSFMFPAYYADAIRWWLNQIKWVTPSSAVNLSAASSSVTFLECAVDFELSTGLRLGLEGSCGPTWADKAKAMAYLMKAAARIFTIKHHGRDIGYNAALRPSPNVFSLSPLGAPLMSGLARRPVWACAHTPQVVAANLWRARAADRLAAAAAPRTAAVPSRSRTFAAAWELNYSGFPAQNRWQPEVLERLYKAAADARNATAPSAAGDGLPRPSSTSHPPRRRPRPELELPRRSGEPPLPTVTRDFKRARLNEPAGCDIPLRSGGSGSRDMLDLNRDVRIHARRPASPGHHGDTMASGGKRPRITGAAASSSSSSGQTTGGHEHIPCAACWKSLPSMHATNLPSPLRGNMSHWRGAAPGAKVCSQCLSTYSGT